MTTHSSLYKRKLTGGKKRAYRTKKVYESGGYPAETILGESKRKIARTKGGNSKVKVLTEKFASVTDPKTNTTSKTEIVRVVSRRKRRLQPQRRHHKRRTDRNQVGPRKSHKPPRQRWRNKRYLSRPISLLLSFLNLISKILKKIRTLL
jgi:hypothetical protein